MSKSRDKFNQSIGDSKKLLELFNKLGKSDPEGYEVLKRAGLIMAFTAWETYVEDRLLEVLEPRAKFIEGSPIGNFFQNKLNEEMKRFNTPTSDKVKKLYKDFLGIEDVTEGWRWSNYDPQKARELLNKWVSARGDVAHHSKEVSTASQPHAVKKDALSKCITFLDGLVKAFDEYLDSKL